MNNKKEFKPLDYMRVLRADEELTTAQFALLVAAVLRTDNSSCRVKMSIEGLAKDAKVSYKTARTLIKTPEVEKYFDKIVRSKNNADFWFHPQPVMVTTSDEQADEETNTSQVVMTTTSGGNSGLSGGNGYQQSAFPSAFSANTEDSAAASSSKDEVKREEKYEYLGSLRDTDFPNLSLEHERLDYFSNGEGVAAVANAVETTRQPQIETDVPDGAISRVDHEGKCIFGGWLFYSQAAADRARAAALVPVGEW